MYYGDLPVSPQTLNAQCLRADCEVTIIPGGPQWCELLLIFYRTLYSTKIKQKTDAVTVDIRLFFFFQYLTDLTNTFLINTL